MWFFLIYCVMKKLMWRKNSNPHWNHGLMIFWKQFSSTAPNSVYQAMGKQTTGLLMLTGFLNWRSIRNKKSAHKPKSTTPMELLRIFTELESKNEHQGARCSWSSHKSSSVSSRGLNQENRFFLFGFFLDAAKSFANLRQTVWPSQLSVSLE